MSDPAVAAEAEDFSSLPPVPSTPENRPVFHDTGGLTAEQYRNRLILDRPPPTDAEIRSHYEFSGSCAATASHFDITAYYVRKSLRREPYLRSVK
ncbi:MAG: hypothetical protein P8O03_03110 [Ilumatobacter sp.]|nr:hypothetical protein [Ilumatobacter sp.]